MRVYLLSVLPLTVMAMATACGGGRYGRSAAPTAPVSASPTVVAQLAGRPDYSTGATPVPKTATAPAPALAASPTEAPAPTSPPPPPASPVSLTVVARGIRFEQTELVVDAGATVTLTFDNQDTASHNVDIQGVAKTDIFAGPGQRTVTFTAPAQGSYTYRCDVHPSAMQGTLVVR